MWFDDNFKVLCAEIKEKVYFVPEYFYAKHPDYRAPMRFLVNSFSRAKRSRFGDELRSRGFVVRYWRPHSELRPV